jgi:polysaccharide deacetylase family protein (PEP-CTERM system associated)
MSDGRGMAASAATPNSALNALTVDLEDWFHICGIDTLAPRHWDALPSRVASTTEWLLDLLDRRQIRATFFVVGWIAKRHPELVQKISRAGHELGSHSYWHRRVYELDRRTFADDVAASCRAVAATGAAPVTAFRAPEWSINESSMWALDELVHLGLRVDASMAPLKLVGSVTFPRQPHVRDTTYGRIVEVPPLVADRFGQVMPIGWGWGLRMSSPLRVLHAIGTLNDEGQSAVLTIHPWELDPDPPRVTLPARLRFAHYFRIGGFRERLSTILAGARFGPISALPAGDRVIAQG